MGCEVAPDATATPPTDMVDRLCVEVGVRVADTTLFTTDAVYDVVPLANVGLNVAVEVNSDSVATWLQVRLTRSE